jgi:serine/threonine protein kinase
MGTAAYMSPEQSRGTQLDDRTDLWSLGVVVYEMLTGQKPFPGETTADILASVIYKEPLPLNSFLENVPAELEWIISKTLSKKPEGRYQTANELRADFEKIKKRIESGDDSHRSLGSLQKVENKNLTAEVNGESAVGDDPSPTADNAVQETDEKHSRSVSGVEDISPKGKTPKVFPMIAGLVLVSLCASAFYYFFG